METLKPAFYSTFKSIYLSQNKENQIEKFVIHISKIMTVERAENQFQLSFEEFKRQTGIVDGFFQNTITTLVNKYCCKKP